MLLWRISPFLDLNGQGGLMYSARWHFAGVPVVYLAESLAGALLELCANTIVDDVPASFTLLKVAGPNLSVEEIPLTFLSGDWVGTPEAARHIGTEWLKSHRSALLQVPSSLVPETWNYLLNPAHPEAALFQIERSYEYPFDLRLKS